MIGASVASFECVFGSGAEFLGCYSSGSTVRPGSFVHLFPDGSARPTDATPGALVSVWIRFEDRNLSFHVHAKVAAPRPGDDPRAVRLELLPEEQERAALLELCAQGDSLPYFRRHFERVPCSVPARVAIEGRKKLAVVVTDISERGLHVAGADLVSLPTGTEVELSIDLPGGLFPIAVRARVASLVSSGPQQGAGFEFLFASAVERSELSRRVELLRSQHAR